MHARDLLSTHRFLPPLASRPRFYGLLALLFIALSSLLSVFQSRPLHAAPRQVTCPAGTIIYVTKTAGGLQTGNSWSNAYVTLQDALAAAAACPSVVQIWVAEGVYYPDESTGQTNNSSAASFAVPPGVALYGGFSGTETALSQRSLVAHVTVLSGDVDGNDTNTDGNAVAEVSSQLQGANAYHVVWMDGTGGTPITATTRIDGFTITAGLANGSSTNNGGGGLYCLGRGAGSQCSPTLANVIFAGNKASYHGGALFADGSDGGDSSPVVVNTVFTGNSARYNGGAVFATGAVGTTGGTSSALFTNVTFYANSGGNGGGIYNDGSGGTCQPVLTNVILWGNTAETSGAQMFNASATPTLAYSLVQGGATGIFNYKSVLNDGGSNGSGDPHFVDGAAVDLRLLLSSAARDAGSSDGAPAVDIRGLPRPVNGVVDIGAYEAQAYGLYPSGGDKQKIGVTEAFTLPLAVTISNPYEWLEPGALVTYTPPPFGPGLSVTEPWLVPVDANGQASSAVQGNNIAGRYAVTVTAPGVITPVIFSLTNTALSVTVARSGTGRGVVISSPAGVVCAPLCSAAFDYGRVVTFTATASTGSVFTGWIGGPTTGGYSVPDPATAAAYAALADAAPEVAAAAVLGAAPGSGPDTQEAEGDSATAVSGGSVSFSITASRLITATFALSHYTVEVSADPPEGGVAGGGGTFAYGTPLTVTAEANVGYRLLYWTVNGAAVTTTAAYSFTLKADRTMVANFTPLPTALADTVIVGRGQAITISVLANDLDPVSALAPSNPGLTVLTTTLPARGTVTIDPDRTRVVYTARPDFLGTDTFTYTAIDANTSTTTGKVTVIVSDTATPYTPPAPGTDPPAPVLTDQLFLPALLR